jgi:uncharacterized protein YciI
MAVFVVTRAHGHAWDDTRRIREQAGWVEHAAFMEALVDDGFILLGGPLGNGERALLVVDAADEAEIHARLAVDPWTPTDMLWTAGVEPWSIWLGDAPLGRASSAR